MGGAEGEKVVKAVNGPATEGTGVWSRGVGVRAGGVDRGSPAERGGAAAAERKIGSGGGGVRGLTSRPPRIPPPSLLTVSNACGFTL